MTISNVLRQPIRYTSARRIRVLVGVVVCGVVPAASWVEGSGAMAWTMYSRGDSFRIDLVTVDGEGHKRVANPSALAVHAAPGAMSLLAGSDHWRSGSAAPLRAHIDEIATLACRELGVAGVELVVWDRVAGAADPDHATDVRRRCTP